MMNAWFILIIFIALIITCGCTKESKRETSGVSEVPENEQVSEQEIQLFHSAIAEGDYEKVAELLKE
jgi:hypothetical protein